MLHLTLPDISHHSRYLEMIEEWENFEDTPTSPSRIFVGENYEELLQIIQNDRSSGRLPGVPASLFFYMDDDTILGAISIWHHTDHPDLQAGGGSNISYGLRPSARGKGLAKEMLGLGLLEAEKLGIEKVLISALEDNPASWKTIEKCGGVFEKSIQKEGKSLKIYSVEIS